RARSRLDILVHLEDVVGIIAGLDACQPSVGAAGIGLSHAGFARIAQEVDVGAATQCFQRTPGRPPYLISLLLWSVCWRECRYDHQRFTLTVSKCRGLRADASHRSTKTADLCDRLARITVIGCDDSKRLCAQAFQKTVMPNQFE